jgi:polyisoprenoid-binding protein YceI
VVWSTHLLLLGAAAIGFGPREAAGQAAFRSPNVPGAANTYQLGDIYLPGSRVYVLVGKTGLGHEHGVVGQLKQGRLRLDQPADAGELAIDMTTFAADTDEARKNVGLPSSTDVSTQQQVNANMRSAEVLDVARFATASFTIKSVKQLPQPSSRNLPQYELDGDFSLHGVTRPIQVMADVEEQGGWLHLRGGFTMLQSQFGITPFRKAFGAVGVSDELKVWGDLWIAKQVQVGGQAPGGP